MPDSKTGRLLPDEVRYLSFEGGGGKGAAYLGVLIAFLRPEFDIFKKGDDGLTYLSDSIEGIAGSSAGAMTAALLGAGVPLEHLLAMVLNLDPIKDGELKKYSNTYNENSVLEAFKDLDLNNSKAIVPNIFTEKGYETRNSSILTSGLKATTSLLDFAPGLTGDLKRLLEVYLQYKTNLSSSDLITAVERVLNDDGLLPGVVMYKHLAFLINKYNDEASKPKLIKRPPQPPPRGGVYQPSTTSTNIPTEAYNRIPSPEIVPPGINFKQIKEKYKRELVITGTNLSRGQVTHFGDRTTPNFSIAAAARISSSIPLLFKPIKISHGDLMVTEAFSRNEQSILSGTWVDGGVLNNHPFHVFDFDKYGNFTGNFERGVKVNPNVLPIVLTDSVDIYSQRPKEPKDTIHGVFSQLAKVAEVMTENSTEAQYKNDNERARTLVVPTSAGLYVLKTEEFAPSREAVLTIGNEAVKATLKYFNMTEDKHPALNIDEMPVGDHMKKMLSFFKNYIK